MKKSIYKAKNNKLYSICHVTKYFTTKMEEFYATAIRSKYEIKLGKLKFETFEIAQQFLDDMADNRGWRFTGEHKNMPFVEVDRGTGGRVVIVKGEI